MKQAKQTSWIVSFEKWQLLFVRRLVRRVGSIFSWLNAVGFTNAVAYIASHLIDPLCASFTGSFVKVKGRAVPVSFINNVDPAFGVPHTTDSLPIYDAAEFPFDNIDCDSNGYHEWVAHFLCLAIKVSYEGSDIVRSIVNGHQGWTFEESFETPQNTAAGRRNLSRQVRLQRSKREEHKLRRSYTQNKSCRQQKYSAEVAAKLIPDTNAFLMTNDKAVVLFFRGTEPAKLVEWWSDAHLDLVSEAGVVHGAVHAGFYEALFYPLTADADSIFQRICRALVAALRGNEKKLYITGHSLGGALTSVFSHAIASLSSEAGLDAVPGAVHVKVDGVQTLLKRVGGIYTFAGPLAGDKDFAAFMVKMYGPDKDGRRKMFRINHSSDIVPKVPPPILGYRHHPWEYFLSFDGFLYDDPQDIELWKLKEELLFTRIFFSKMYNNWTIFAPDGKNVVGADPEWVIFRRCAWHTLVRIFFWTGGFLILFPLQGILRCVPDHWPSDYEVKLRIMAKELQAYKQLPPGQKTRATTHLLSKLQSQDLNPDTEPEE